MSGAYSSRICVGLAGFGMSGQIFQAPFLSCDPRFRLKKVYERTSNKAKQEYPEVEIVRNFESLLVSDIDLVVISTPNPYHVPMAIQAMKAGKHVVVEKPVAATSKEADELYKIAKKEKVLLTVYQNRRLDGDFLTVKKIIEENRIGEVVDFECHFDRFVNGRSTKQWKSDGGKGIDLLYDIGIHLIDQAYTIFGMPDEVYADLRKQRKESSGIDNFHVYLYYADKKIILSASELVAMHGPHFMVHGR
ncbi:MAG: Gfo/Idh/MocA family oxidoreductase, partial [Lachnospiraceae bacterium]|nr:Gfo/Idh/MocA family oxidoreductase [Lachnospiraceae bacterium]